MDSNPIRSLILAAKSLDQPEYGLTTVVAVQRVFDLAVQKGHLHGSPPQVLAA